MAETVTVWRVEHRCPDLHGPCVSCTEPRANWNRPDYGTILETPATDHLLQNVYNSNLGTQCIYGTLPEQFPRWWGCTYDEQGNVLGTNISLPGEWYAVCFSVLTEKVWIGLNQVMFLRDYATEILVTKTEFPR